MKKKNIVRNFILFLLVVCMTLTSMPTNYYGFDEDDTEYYMQGSGNKSTTYYKWMKIRSIEEVEAIVARYGKNTAYRCMLLCSDFDEDPKEIGLFDTKNYWDDRFVKPNLSDIPAIKYNEDIFFTRGGLMTPYIEFLGLGTNKVSGEGEKVKLYTPNRKDEKTSTMICNTTDDDDPRMYMASSSSFNGTYDESPAFDYWIMSFPEQNRNNYMGIPGTGSELVGFCMPEVKQMDDKIDAPWLTWDYAWGADYNLSFTPAWSADREKKEVILFECYIGIPIEKNNVKRNQSLRIEGDTTVVWEDCSLNNGTVYVEDGGTLIISGTCINNGRIYAEDGGTVILQKGALFMPLEPHTEWNACLDVWYDATIIIREGARVLGSQAKTQNYMIHVGNKGTLVNYGYILGEFTGISLRDGARYIKSTSGIQKLVSFDFKAGNTFLAGYDKEDPYRTLDRYMAAVHSECYQLMHLAKDPDEEYLATGTR